MIGLLPLIQDTAPERISPDQIRGLMSLTPSQLAFITLASIAVQVLCGFWARSRADDHGVNPWVAFAAGFLLGPLGALIVPILKKDAVFFTPARRPLGPPPGALGPPGAPLPYGSPVPQSPPPPIPAAPAIIVGADGCFACPACGARVRAGRRSCMACGVPLPRT